ncbi:hypothetical protein [Chamaesiphon sp. GL140_3_metabinner_50]|uniref:hypothetical protein n=1 Tax=Chamaesiphon sp. GL140_3_metabinner_50 TaxID=2970812 RepID=UPI00345A84B2
MLKSGYLAREGKEMSIVRVFQLPDSIQIATAIVANCDAFLTNDVALKNVTEIRAIVVCKLEV